MDNNVVQENANQAKATFNTHGEAIVIEGDAVSIKKPLVIVGIICGVVAAAGIMTILLPVIAAVFYVVFLLTMLSLKTEIVVTEKAIYYRKPFLVKIEGTISIDALTAVAYRSNFGPALIVTGAGIRFVGTLQKNAKELYEAVSALCK